MLQKKSFTWTEQQCKRLQKKKTTGNKRDPETTHTSHALVMQLSSNVKMAEKGKIFLRDELMYKTYS